MFLLGLRVTFVHLLRLKPFQSALLGSSTFACLFYWLLYAIHFAGRINLPTGNQDFSPSSTVIYALLSRVLRRVTPTILLIRRSFLLSRWPCSRKSPFHWRPKKWKDDRGTVANMWIYLLTRPQEAAAKVRPLFSSHWRWHAEQGLCSSKAS